MTRPPRSARLAALALAVAAAACSHSPPTRFLTLDAAAGPARPDYRGPPVALPAVVLPAALDRAEYAAPAGPGRVRVSDFDRWAAPLGRLARDTLVLDLTARLPAGSVLPPDAPVPAGATRVDAAVLSLDPGGRMRLAYAVHAPGQAPLRRVVDLAAPASGADATAAATTFSALLAQAADRIAADLPDTPAPAR